MDDRQLSRYSRHIMLPQVGPEGQQRLLRSRVLVIGLGGLGSPVTLYLAASGVGHLVVVDYDLVDESNLQRQIVHPTAAIGRDKASSAAETLRALNPTIRITALNCNLPEHELTDQVRLADAVVDATDNFTTRFELNQVCVRERKPLISGAVIRMEGQVTVFRPDRPGGACYRCLYQDLGEEGEACSEVGILAPVAGIIGCIQATETIKILLDIGETLAGRLLLLDASTMEWRTVKLRKDPNCPVCGSCRSD